MADLPPLAHLRRYNRLKASYSFSKTMQKGQMFPGKYLTCYILPKKYGPLRLGVACAKCTPNAVWRNYYKRRLRQAYQSNLEFLRSLNLGSLDCVLLAKHFPNKVSAADYCRDFSKILHNLSLHVRIKR